LGIAEDLLRQANHLATYEGADPTQAALRRAISTAYYALFHLLVEDASQRWQGSSEAATGFQRSFNHGVMKNSSTLFSAPQWEDWQGTVQAVPQDIRRVAGSFINLQQERHIADYNNHEEWTQTEVDEILQTTRKAFESWSVIRTHPMAGNYLLSMLLGKPRQ
jgi:uncharacterized protein (UPF0332 family)